MSAQDDKRTPVSSSRKRKAGAMSSASFPRVGPVHKLVPATNDGLTEMRLRVATVVKETIEKRLAGTATDERGRGQGPGSNGPAAGNMQQQQMEDPSVTSYLQALQSAIMTKVKSMCDVQDDREQREAEELMREIIEFDDEMLAARERLDATRARVARLAAETCRDSLRLAEAADNRAVAALEAKIEQARKERDERGTLLLPHGPLGAVEDVDAAATGVYAGIIGDVLEPKVSLLIGKLSELPGPLKSVLQEIPELTASLAKMVQKVEETMTVRDSRTEKLLGKAPPTPLPKGNAAAAGATGSRHPPEEIRETARKARLEQARKEWETAGDGLLGGMFS
ncbi:unnamed protein product [Ascophyllum nodosum]